MANTRSNRKKYIDIAKGILILLVVIGHASVDWDKYIYWFHMPAFFVLSGMLLKKDESIQSWLSWTSRQFKRLALPYFTFYLVHMVVAYYIHQPEINLELIGQDLYNMAYGGRMAVNVFWFITCLYLSQVIFKLLIVTLSRKWVIFLTVLFYAIAHYEAIVFIGEVGMDVPENKKFLWNADVALLAIPYMAVGFYLKDWLNRFTEQFRYLLGFAILATVFVWLDLQQVLDYSLDMKYSQYHSWVLDMLIPVVFTVVTIGVSKLLENVSASALFRYLGINSLIIMYMHVTLNYLFSHWFDYGSVWYTIIGTVIPLILSNLFIRRELTHQLFLGGKMPTKKV